MNHPVTIVIPSLADRELLLAGLAALRTDLATRTEGDEILVVDDSGQGRLAEWLGQEEPGVRTVANTRNLGFGASLLAGVQSARHELIFALNPDVHVRPGCLNALVETLTASPAVWAVSPFVLLNGDEVTDESLPDLEVSEGLPRIVRKSLEVTPGEPHSEFPGGVPVAFALGGACLFRRDEFLSEPFDERFEPFYWEDVDLSQRALTAGRRVLVDPRAVVEHHHRGTIGAHVPETLVRAAIEKNRLLFAWKHLRGAALEQNLHALAARVIEHGLAEDREELIWLALALEQEFSASGEPSGGGLDRP